MKTIFILLTVFLSVTLAGQDYGFTYAGKTYKIITTQKTWQQAVDWAMSTNGYLAEIGSQEEQDSIYAAVVASGISTTYTAVPDGGGVAYLWIGATDEDIEGFWQWDGDNNGVGLNFYNGEGDAGSGNGAAEGGAYIHWGGSTASGGSSTMEPDDFNNNQDYAAMALAPWPAGSGALGIAGEWNDLSGTNTLYFIVEYDNSANIIEPQNEFRLTLWKKEISCTEIIEEIQIYNVQGQLVLNLNPNSKSFQIDLEETGLFFYTVRTKEGIIRKGKLLI